MLNLVCDIFQRREADEAECENIYESGSDENEENDSDEYYNESNEDNEKYTDM